MIWSLVTGNEDDREAVVSLAPHRLDSRCSHPRFDGQQLIEAAYRPNVRVVSPRVGDGSVPYDVVGDDEAARMGKLERPDEVFWVTCLVGVDERQVERATMLMQELWKSLLGSSKTYLNNLG